MPITSIPSNIIIPKQPKIYVYTNNSSVVNTWYTAITATGIRGILSKIGFTTDTGLNTLLEIRITIDGVINTIGNPSGQNGALGLNHGANTSNTYQALDSIDYFSNVFFYNSLQVEFRRIGGTGTQILGNIQYSTE